jgi:hypothetical protein
MKRFLATFLALAAGAGLATAVTPDATQSSGSAPAVSTTAPTAASGSQSATPKPAKPKSPHVPLTAQTLAQMQASLDELSKSNHDLLDLLKQQQAVLQDIQYDRRLQSRQIDNLESRLEEALTEKEQLQKKIDQLELQAETRPAVAQGNSAPPPNTPPPAPGDATSKPPAGPPPMPKVEDVKPPDANTPPAAADATPPPPATYLPPEGADNPPGQQSWHRIVTLKGMDNQQTEVFTVHGKLWRVLWHNQDKAGKLYANTSALFINAYPRDDTIPEKVCSKLGTGGDSTELQGPGNYYLKIEASGGSWELAIEDFR